MNPNDIRPPHPQFGSTYLTNLKRHFPSLLYLPILGSRSRRLWCTLAPLLPIRIPTFFPGDSNEIARNYFFCLADCSFHRRRYRAFFTRSVSPGLEEKFVLVVHGGAGNWKTESPEQLDADKAAINKAAETGYKILASGGSSLDAVEATLRVMEDSGLFDAGRGGYYDRDGVPELDSAIMDGRTLGAGAVAAVKHIANPISLARLVMEKTPHVLIVGDGAEQFAKSQGIELVSPYYFYNERLLEDVSGNESQREE